MNKEITDEQRKYPMFYTFSTLFDYEIIPIPICHKKEMHNISSSHSGSHNEYEFQCEKCKRKEVIKIDGLTDACSICKKKQAIYELVLHESNYNLKYKYYCKECADKEQIFAFFEDKT